MNRIAVEACDAHFARYKECAGVDKCEHNDERFAKAYETNCQLTHQIVKEDGVSPSRIIVIELNKAADSHWVSRFVRLRKA